MKKLIMMAAMVATGAAAFAQTTAKEEADKWNKSFKEQYEQYSTLFTESQANQLKKEGERTKVDSMAMFTAGVEALKCALKCDEFDAQPNEKGKVKMRYRQATQPMAQNLRIVALQAGQYFNSERKDLEGAFDAWSLYVDSHDAPLFTGVDLSQDQYYAQFAYYSGLLAYQLKDYTNAEKYAKKCQDVAGDDAKLKGDAAEILLFSKKDNCKTAADSAAFAAQVMEMHKAEPTEGRYFNMLLDYYNHNPEKKMAWLVEETSINPQNKMVWAIKGETEMREEKWDAAIESYKKALEIDPSFVAVVFNVGTCYNSKAVALKDQLANKKTGALTAADAAKVKAALQPAKEYLEKAKELDPNRESVNWAYALYQVYYSLGDSAKSAEMEKLVNQ